MKSLLFAAVFSLCSALFAKEVLDYSHGHHVELVSEKGVIDPKMPSHDDVSTHHYVAVSGVYHRIYVERKVEVATIYQNGDMGGFTLSYQYLRPNFFHAGARFRWTYGSLKSEGSLESDFESSILRGIFLEENLGYRWKAGSFQLTPYVGFGYRQMRYQIVSMFRATTEDLWYNSFYFPLGLALSVSPIESLSIGVNAAWLAQAFPTVTRRTHDKFRSKLNTQLNNFRVEVPLAFKNIGLKNLDIVFLASFEQWVDGALANLPTDLIERIIPSAERNRLISWGGEVKIRYGF